MLITPDKSNIYILYIWKRNTFILLGGLNKIFLAFFIFELYAFVYFDCPWIFKKWMLAEKKRY